MALRRGWAAQPLPATTKAPAKALVPVKAPGGINPLLSALYLSSGNMTRRELAASRGLEETDIPEVLDCSQAILPALNIADPGARVGSLGPTFQDRLVLRDPRFQAYITSYAVAYGTDGAPDVRTTADWDIFDMERPNETHKLRLVGLPSVMEVYVLRVLEFLVTGATDARLLEKMPGIMDVHLARPRGVSPDVQRMLNRYGR